MNIKTPIEFNFSECLEFLNRSDNECLHSIEGEKIRKLLKANKKLLLIEISNAGKQRIQIEFLNINPDETVKNLVVEYVKEWFDLSYQMNPFYKMAEKDGVLNSVVNDYRGLRLIGIPDFFEAITWAIIGQHINLRLAYSMKRKFVEAFGEALRYDGKTYWLFPDAEAIAKITVDDLMMFQFTRKKAEYIIAIAQSLIDGKLDSEGFKVIGDYETVKKELMNLKGVGNWTANYVLMKYFRFPQAFPIEDVGLHNAIKQRFGWTEKPSIEKIRELAEAWKGYEAYATFYLWRSFVQITL
ncbi:MAG: DNA-3-methyladenine glycosylase [Bacteroidetes bacterium]|nr:DNA-3-methyladenine glycosylase [Bacteroidota bacterium]